MSSTLGPKRARCSGRLSGLPLAWVFAGILCLASNARSATFTASIDRDSITLGEIATLSLTFVGGQPKDVPVPPEIPNLQITYLGPSSEFSYNNGQMSSTVTHSFRVAPRQAGDYTIPALAADVGGQKLTSQPLLLKVLKPGAPPPQAVQSGTQPAFIKVVVPRKEVYVGETFSAQLQCYLQSRLQRVYQLQLSGFNADGFTVGKMAEGQQRQTQIGNSVYTIIPVNVALRVTRTGALTLGPVTFNLVPQRDPFDPFGMFGNRNAAQPMTLASETETVQALPLPRENVPPDFTGAIGNYTLAVSAGPTEVKAGDPITVKIQISGRGWLDALTLPEHAAWKDFKTYAPSSKVDLTDPLGIQGAKTFEQIVTPESTDIKALPPITFAFFDPDKKAYRTLSQPAIPLTVRPAGSTPAPVILAGTRQDGAPPTPDIVPNKQRLGAVALLQPPVLRQTWFVALQGVPLLAFLGAFAWRKRCETLANNPRLRRRRQVDHLLRQGLAELRQLAAANNSEQFFATVFRLLQERLGERLDLPASAITEAVIDERLRPRGVPETALKPLEDIFQTCNLARYAPVKNSQELVAVASRLEVVLRSLEEVKL